VGLATFPEDAVDIPDLLRRADHAMYATKRSGGGYTPAEREAA
jgi:predicted signal transduction protein with EAL and GGDEF domain